jgi:Lysine methyltransferase
VWRGALVLADYVLANSASFRGTVGLELGAGTGLAGLSLARFARRVVLTDAVDAALDLCQARCRPDLPSCAQHPAPLHCIRQLNAIEALNRRPALLAGPQILQLPRGAKRRPESRNACCDRSPSRVTVARKLAARFETA